MFELTGGVLCLDFANTVDDRPTDRPKELLPDYRRLLSWSMQTRSLSKAAACELQRRAEESPAAAAVALAHARVVREAVFAIFSTAARAERPPVRSVASLNEAMRQAFARLQLEPATGSYRWRWRDQPLDLERPLWPVVRSAADLLTSADVLLVRECDAANCGWLFLDRSRNRTRRWCDMKVCGNRNKARRHRAARQAGRGSRA